MKDFIKRNCGDDVLRRSALTLGNAEEVFRTLLEGKGFSTALEIGTYRGVSAACMSQYVDRVITIDLLYGRLEETDPGFSREDLWETLGVNNVDLRLVKDKWEEKLLVDSLPFDFVFIDGGHSFDQVAFDYELVKKCKHILFHDYSYSGVREKDGVWNFVNTLDESKITVYDDIFAYYQQ